MEEEAMGPLTAQPPPSTFLHSSLSIPLCSFLRNVLRLLATANFVPISPIFVTLMMVAVLVRATRRDFPEDEIVHCDRRETHKSYVDINRLMSLAETQCVSCEVRTGFISQKTAFFIVTAMKTSNLT
jgi:hypothetical protein